MKVHNLSIYIFRTFKDRNQFYKQHLENILGRIKISNLSISSTGASCQGEELWGDICHKDHEKS